MNVIFVCTANASRSPMAEALFRRYLREQGVADVTCASAGVEVVEGLPANEITAAVCAEIGVDLTGHVRRQLRREDLEAADVVVVMEESHRDAVLALGGAFDKIYLLGGGIGDPYGQPREAYDLCREAVLKSLPALLRFIQEKQMEYCTD